MDLSQIKDERATKYVGGYKPYVISPMENEWTDLIVDLLLKYKETQSTGIEKTIDATLTSAFRELLYLRVDWANELVFSAGEIYESLVMQKNG